MGARMLWSSIISTCLMVRQVAGNWDPATGNLIGYSVSESWQKQNPAVVVTSDIQVSECAKNTRLHYPKVQLFALFKQDHTRDNHHGCPYGDCLAFTAVPGPDDMVPVFTDAHSFFWHDTGGLPGDPTKPISDPQTGAYGYEVSLTGKFKVGSEDTSSMQRDHDEYYPGFSESSLKRWTSAERARFQTNSKSDNMQPKCGRPCEPNKDPGSSPGAYGGYTPANASQYTPPPLWKPSAQDTCYKNGSSDYSSGAGSTGSASSPSSNYSTGTGNQSSSSPPDSNSTASGTAKSGSGHRHKPSPVGAYHNKTTNPSHHHKHSSCDT